MRCIITALFADCRRQAGQPNNRPETEVSGPQQNACSREGWGPDVTEPAHKTRLTKKAEHSGKIIFFREQPTMAMNWRFPGARW
ncbi:MAG: hypothetical protein GY774_05930 [Planctomycetes bacterium]|nr:hypothetical protein [Planctomycetota bacterium]